MIRLVLAALAVACLLSPADAKSRGGCVETGSVMVPVCGTAAVKSANFLEGVRSIRVTMKRERSAVRRHKGASEGPKAVRKAPKAPSNLPIAAAYEPFHPVTDLVSRARAYMGTNPTGWRHVWCGRFMAMIAPTAASHVRNPNLAKAWLALRHTSGSVGDIAVLGRRGGGHVGVVTGFDSAGNPVIVSGNHGHRVGEGVYARGRVLAFVSSAE